jgi:hypothetical protein
MSEKSHKAASTFNFGTSSSVIPRHSPKNIIIPHQPDELALPDAGGGGAAPLTDAGGVVAAPLTDAGGVVAVPALPVPPRRWGSLLGYVLPAPCFLPATYTLPPLLCDEGECAWGVCVFVFPVLVLLFGLLVLCFSLWYWFGASGGLTDFWLQFATLTNWGLLLTAIHHLSFGGAALLPKRWLWVQARLRVATLHLWPTIFCLQLVILIGFWTGACEFIARVSLSLPLIAPGKTN